MWLLFLVAILLMFVWLPPAPRLRIGARADGRQMQMSEMKSQSMWQRYPGLSDLANLVVRFHAGGQHLCSRALSFLRRT